MTIEQLSSTLQEFILEQDAVWVPGLGLFRGVIEPASIVDRGYTIAPPYRRLVFSSQCPQQEPSCSLPALYASRYKLPQEQTDAEFNAVVRDIREQLKECGSVQLPALGKIVVSGRDDMLFVADLDIDIYPDGFGLESVSLKNREKSAPMPSLQPLPQVQEMEPVEPSHSVKKKSGMPVGMQILVCLLVLLFIAGAAFFLLAHFAPDVLDTLLYSPQELELLKSEGI